MLYFSLYLVLMQWISGISPQDLIWKNRVFIYSGKENCQTWTQPTLESEIKDRKLVYLIFEGNELKATNLEGDVEAELFLTKVNEQTPNQNGWVLIGLDGGVKRSGTLLPNPTEIFKTIDAMPMRQSELRRGGNF